MNIPISVADALEWANTKLGSADLWYGHGTDSAWDEAVLLLAGTGAIDAHGTDDQLQMKLSETQFKSFTELVDRRIRERIPAVYLTGKCWFAGLEFDIDERVLVPRSPIAELIETRYRPWVANPPQSILDLCCGSGCIGVATAHAFPDARVVLSDISKDALHVARANVEKHQLTKQYQLVESDLFENVPGMKFDLIVSNPPYVDEGDIASMPPEYRHEPEIGLGSGRDGLELTRKILQQAPAFLSNQGTLIVEVGNSWLALEESFPNFPFSWIEFERGGHGVFALSYEQLMESGV